MYYVIEQNLFREYNFKNLIHYLGKYGLEWELVPYRPFISEVPIKTDRKDVWFFGSINAGKVVKERDWSPGIIFNSNFDYSVYLKEYGKWMLNSDGRVQEFDYIPNWLEGEKFIKPANDTKTFESNLYTPEQWNKYVEEVIENRALEDIRNETKVMYCSPKKNIYQEIRCWIVDGKLITCSQYRVGRTVHMLNMDNNPDPAIFVRDMCKIFQPARAFVMDICLHEDDYKIVELGCIHHCGFYDADMSKLIQSLENTFGHGLSTGIPTADPARAGKTG
jgi:hypothetical protein